jgi:hypothetical protein
MTSAMFLHLAVAGYAYSLSDHERGKVKALHITVAITNLICFFMLLWRTLCQL